MSKSNKNTCLFNHDPNYVITPTYETRAELDEHVQMLFQKSKQRGYSDRIPQRVFLQILGMRQPLNSREYKNDVLLNTGVVHMVCDKKHRPQYFYMQFTVEKNNQRFRDTIDTPVRRDLNTYTG